MEGSAEGAGLAVGRGIGVGGGAEVALGRGGGAGGMKGGAVTAGAQPAAASRKQRAMIPVFVCMSAPVLKTKGRRRLRPVLSLGLFLGRACAVLPGSVRPADLERERDLAAQRLLA